MKKTKKAKKIASVAANIGTGDKLASGAIRARFYMPVGVSQKKWDNAFKDFDPETFEMPKAETGAKEIVKRG